MPRPETSHRRQQAVLWPVASFDQHGQTTVGDPEQIRVRWVNKRRQVRDARGNVITVDATAHVGQDIGISSRMWLGTLEEWTDSGSTAVDAPVMEVVAFDVTHDVKGRLARREAHLVFFKGSPTNG